MLTRLKNLIDKKEIPEFNSVIEGTYHDEWGRLNYKLANLTVPENISLIKDGTYEYHFFGKSKDFKTIDRTPNRDSLEIQVDSLSFGAGLVLPFIGGIPNILERPRAIALKDGRIFIEDHMIKEDGYLEAVPAILKSAQILFNDKVTNDNYKKIMESYNFSKEQRGGFTVYSS